MKRFILKVFMWVYVNLIRSWLSPLLYYFLRVFIYRGGMPDKFEKIRDKDINEFHREIAIYRAYDYHLDPLRGILDFSPREENFFFKEYIESGRDCGAWARLWKFYFDYHNIENKEIVMLNTDNLFYENGVSAHLVCVAKTGEKWELFDYRPTQNREESIDKALENNVVGYDEFVWVTLKR